MASLKELHEALENNNSLYNTIKRVLNDTTHITVLNALSHISQLPSDDPVKSVRLVDNIFYIKHSLGWTKFCRFEDLVEKMLTIETANGKYLYGESDET
jgi:hypothetical protein